MYFCRPFCSTLPVLTTSIVKVCYISNWITIIIAEFSTWKYISAMAYILFWSKPFEILYFMPTQVIDCNRIIEGTVAQIKRNRQKILQETFSTKVHFYHPSSVFSSIFVFLILLATSTPSLRFQSSLLHADLACSVTDLLFRLYCCVIKKNLLVCSHVPVKYWIVEITSNSSLEIIIWHDWSKARTGSCRPKTGAILLPYVTFHESFCSCSELEMNCFYWTDEEKGQLVWL